jgi:hypothetical protein
LENANEKAFTSDEIQILKFLNKEKQNLKTKENIITYLKKILKLLGYDTAEALYYYYLFSLNYRPDGRYEDIKKGEQKDLSGIRGGKIPNYKISQFAKARIPFKASNIEGFWEKDPNRVDQFVITSYGWYPIFIYKDGKWYKTSNTYSKSTSKQMSQTNIYSGVEFLTPNEMTLLRNGKSSDSLVAGKLEQSLNYLKERYSDRPFNFTSYWQRENQYATKVRVKYKVDNVREENDSIVMDVEVLEVVFTDGQNRIISRELPEETKNLKKEIEQNLSIIISSEAPQNLKDYLRKKLVLNTDFNF